VTVLSDVAELCWRFVGCARRRLAATRGLVLAISIGGTQ